MTKHEREEAFKKFLDAWGLDAQVTMCVEEMSELIKELCKFKRFGYFEGARAEEITTNIIEEIADVYNTVDQIALLLGQDKIEKVRDEKIARALKKLEK